MYKHQQLEIPHCFLASTNSIYAGYDEANEPTFKNTPIDSWVEEPILLYVYNSIGSSAGSLSSATMHNALKLLPYKYPTGHYLQLPYSQRDTRIVNTPNEKHTKPILG